MEPKPAPPDETETPAEDALPQANISDVATPPAPVQTIPAPEAASDETPVETEPAPADPSPEPVPAPPDPAPPAELPAEAPPEHTPLPHLEEQKAPPKPPSNGLTAVIVTTVFIVIALSALAVYAYMQSKK